MSTLTILALLILEGIAIRSIWLQPMGNGLSEAMDSIRTTFPQILPGSNNATLVTDYTAFEPLDNVLATLYIAFVKIFDGTTPAFSLLGFYFAGQFLPVWVVTMVEGLRDGNKGEIVSFITLFGMLAQTIRYAATMPIYCILYLFTSLTAVETPANVMGQLVRITDVGSLGAIVPALVTGLIIPTGILALRPFYDSTLHQYLLAVWQLFPVWVKLSQLVFSSFFAPLKRSEDRTREMKYLRFTYRFALNAAAFTHVATFVMLARIHFFPDKIKNPSLLGLTPADVFLPQPFWSTDKMASFENGVHGVFLHDMYVGTAAALVLAVALYRCSRDATATLVRGPSLVVELLGSLLFSGLGGVVVALMWRRDEEVAAAEERVKKLKSK